MSRTTDSSVVEDMMQDKIQVAYIPAGSVRNTTTAQRGIMMSSFHGHPPVYDSYKGSTPFAAQLVGERKFVLRCSCGRSTRSPSPQQQYC
jgi:hypothetical protein